MDDIFGINLNLDLRKAINSYKEKKDNLLLEDIYILKTIFDEQGIDNIYIDNYELYKLVNKYKKIGTKNSKDFYNSIIKNKDNHIIFSNYKDLIDLPTMREPKIKEKLSFKENKEIAYDFMKQYDINFYNTFKWIKSNHHFKIERNKDNIGGYVYLLNSIKPYMVINLKRNIYDASTIVHETAHVYQMENNFFKSKKYPYFYQEVYSNYMQMLFYKYLEDNHLYKDDVKALKLKKLIYLKRYLNNMNDDLCKYNLKSYKEEHFQYSYGIGLALYYYNMYLNDPEACEYYMDWFIKSSTCFEQQDVLNRSAIDKNKIITKEIINNFMK